MSWTILPVSAEQVRTYLDITSTSGQFSDALIGSNIRAAASFLQRETSRQFEPQTTTKTFTTNGVSYLAIPDLRSASAVSLQSTTLIATETYHLIPDAQQSGVYTGIQFRAFGRDYRSNPDWFDRNLDVYAARGYDMSSLPNDLSITGDWGHSPLPDEFRDAVLIYAAFKTRRPASVLANSQITPEGNQLNYSQLPPEVAAFIESWRAGSQLVSI
jgi:hypothetical protein